MHRGVDFAHLSGDDPRRLDPHHRRLLANTRVRAALTRQASYPERAVTRPSPAGRRPQVPEESALHMILKSSAAVGEQLLPRTGDERLSDQLLALA